MSSAAQRLLRDFSDAELIQRTREGDVDAYGVLFDRHAAAATALATHLTRGTPVAPDDVVSDAFVGVLTAIRSGHGPEESFRAYLYTTVRNGAAALRARSARTISVDDPADYETPVETPDPAVTAFESEVVQRAFTSLSERWQAVLWYAEVEGMKPAAIAPLLGVRPNAVSALLIRAREGLRDAYVSAHLEAADDARPECRWTAQRLGAHARGTLSARDRRKVGSHLDDCRDCRMMAVEASEVTRGLHLVIAPFVLGVAGAAWLATQRGGPTGAEIASASAAAAAGSAVPSRPAAKTAPGPILAASGAAAAVVTVAALALGGVLGSEAAPPSSAPSAPVSPAPEAAVKPSEPAEDEPAEEPAPEESTTRADEPASPPRAAAPPAVESAPPPAGSTPPPAEEPEGPEEPGPLPVTMTQSVILGRMSIVDPAQPVLGMIGAVQEASVVWAAEDPMLAHFITFDLAAGQFTVAAHTVHTQTLPSGAVRYIATADATAIVTAFSGDTWSVDQSFGAIDWHIRVVEVGTDPGGVELEGPLSLAPHRPVMVTLDAPGTGTAFVTTVDGTVVTSSVIDGVLVMEATQPAIVQRVTVVFDP